MKPTQAQFEAYQKIFDYFNQALFHDSLPDCMLRFSRHKKGNHKQFTAEGWEGKAGQKMPEISLSLKSVRERPPQEVMGMLVREMVHLWQETYGNPSRKGYYNREWADRMEEVGLIASKYGKSRGKTDRAMAQALC